MKLKIINKDKVQVEFKSGDIVTFKTSASSGIAHGITGITINYFIYY